MEHNCSVGPIQAVQTFNFFLFIGFSALSCFSFVFFVFAKYRLRLERLRVRSVIPIFGSFLAVHAIITSGLLRYPFSIPCAYSLSATLLVVPLLGVTILIRLMLIVLLNRYALLLQVRLMDEDANGDEDEASTVVAQPKRRSCCQHPLFYSLMSIKSLIVFSDDDFNRFTKQRRQKTLRSLNFLRGFQGNVLLFWALLSPFLFAIVVILAVRNDDIFSERGDCHSCNSVLWISSYFIMVAAIIIILCLLFAVFRLRTLVDPWGLRHELHWVVAFCLFILFFYILERTVPVPISGYYNHAILIAISGLVVLQVQTLLQIYLGWGKRIVVPQQAQVNNVMLYPPIYPFNFDDYYGGDDEDDNKGDAVGALSNTPHQQQSSNRQKRNNQQTRSDMVPNTQAQPHSFLLGSVLANPEAMGEFESHLVAELSMEYLLFVKDCQKWKEHYPQLHPELRLTRARRIYNQYVDQWGVYAIEFPSHISNEIAQSLGRQQKKLSSSSTAVANSSDLKITVFDDAEAYVAQILENGALSRFHQHTQQADASAGGEVRVKGGTSGKKSSSLGQVEPQQQLLPVVPVIAISPVVRDEEEGHSSGPEAHSTSSVSHPHDDEDVLVGGGVLGDISTKNDDRHQSNNNDGFV